MARDLDLGNVAVECLEDTRRCHSRLDRRELSWSVDVYCCFVLREKNLALEWSRPSAKCSPNALRIPTVTGSPVTSPAPASIPGWACATSCAPALPWLGLARARGGGTRPSPFEGRRRGLPAGNVPFSATPGTRVLRASSLGPKSAATRRPAAISPIQSPRGFDARLFAATFYPPVPPSTRGVEILDDTFLILCVCSELYGDMDTIQKLLPVALIG